MYLSIAVTQVLFDYPQQQNFIAIVKVNVFRFFHRAD